VLFLDGVGELPLDAQTLLLSAVETGRITRSGSGRTIGVDVCIISATNCDVERIVEEKSFRKDLSYRLNTVTLELPPLRERRDEIKPLAEFYSGPVMRNLEPAEQDHRSGSHEGHRKARPAG
jgi:DNA-binding NtrC family response regulator